MVGIFDSDEDEDDFFDAMDHSAVAQNQNKHSATEPVINGVVVEAEVISNNEEAPADSFPVNIKVKQIPFLSILR